MKLLKIEHPTTKNAKISRILFMIMTVLFAVYMCPMCYNDFVMASHRVQITQDAAYVLQWQWSSLLRAETLLYLFALIYYAVAAVAILLLCLRTSLKANVIACGLAAVGTLSAVFLNSELAEFMVYRYGILSFLYDSTEPWATWYVLVKPVSVVLMLAAATYFLVARLVEHQKEIAQPTE